MKKIAAVFFAAALIVLGGCSSALSDGGQESAPAEQSSASSALESGDTELSEQESSSESADAEQDPGESSSEISSESETSAPVSGDPLLIVVNAANPIPGDYQVELEAVQGDYKMNALAAPAARELIAAAKEAGYSLMVVSGYRTVATSERLYNNKVQQYINGGWGEEAAKAEAAKWVAPPGTSEHHTGLAMDIVSSDYFTYYADLEHDFEKFDEFTWLYEHCADYGFILRYPKDKQEVTGITYEPWHYRYVGIENAKAIMSAGLCLEEYVGG